MKPQIIILIIAILISSMAGISYASYQVGLNKTVAKYNELAAKITEDALREREALQTKLDEISHEYFTSTSNEKTRIAQLQRQLRDRQNVVECVEDSGGDSVAIYSDSTSSLLSAAVRSKALPKATGQPCPISETGTVTTDLLPDYTICIIGEYNGVAGQLTGLIDSVNQFAEQQDKQSQ